MIRRFMFMKLSLFNKKNFVSFFLFTYLNLGLCEYLFCCREPYGKIEGRITDKTTGLPIAGAVIDSGKYTTSDKDGRYQKNVHVWVKEFKVYAEGYKDYEFEQKVIKDQTVVYNIEMIPDPDSTAFPLTAAVQGVITLTKEGGKIPLANALIFVGDNIDNFYTRSNGDGSYMLRTKPGEWAMSVMFEEGFYYEEDVKLSENETLDRNITVNLNSEKFRHIPH